MAKIIQELNKKKTTLEISKAIFETIARGKTT